MEPLLLLCLERLPGNDVRTLLAARVVILWYQEVDVLQGRPHQRLVLREQDANAVVGDDRRPDSAGEGVCVQYLLFLRPEAHARHLLAGDEEGRDAGFVRSQ